MNKIMSVDDFFVLIANANPDHKPDIIFIHERR
jgi:hypothetical protein